jgi:DNA-binding XRE family transcriptional regulator
VYRKKSEKMPKSLNKPEKAEKTPPNPQKTLKASSLDKTSDKTSGKTQKNKSEQKQVALDLYLYTPQSQKDIAEIVGVSEQTVCKWKEEGKWEELKGANSLSANQIISNLYKHALDLSENPAGNADAIAKIAASIERLKPTKVTLTNYITSFQDLGRWLAKNNFLEEAKILTKVQKIFINEQLK